MSQLLYFRHAQASYGKADYDQLSPMGYEQSDHLGEFLVRKEVAFDHIYVGPLKRHHQTLSRVQEAYRRAGAELPEPVVMRALEEHRGPDILKSSMARIREEDELILSWDNERRANPDLNIKKGLMIFERAMELWATGKLEHLQPPHYLNWRDFRSQVGQGYEQVMERHREDKGATIGMFTSGGTISATMGHILGMSDDKDIIGLNGIVQNTSISEILFSGSRVTLKSFNDVSHLPEHMKTYV